MKCGVSKGDLIETSALFGGVRRFEPVRVVIYLMSTGIDNFLSDHECVDGNAT